MNEPVHAPTAAERSALALYVQRLGQQAKLASAAMARACTADKNKALKHLAALLREHSAPLQQENAKDLERASAAGLSEKNNHRCCLAVASLLPVTQRLRAYKDLRISCRKQS